MRVLTISIGAFVLVALSASSAGAQGAPEPSGHWEGILQTPMMGDVPIGFDLAKKANGTFIGTFDQPLEHLRGMPLQNVLVEGAAVTLDLASSSGGRFEGLLASDGKTMTGDFNGPFATVPFSVTRKSDARFEPDAKGGVIDARMEGTWLGEIVYEEGRFPVELHMANEPGGTSSSYLVDVDEGRLQVPASVNQKGTFLALSVPMTGGSYAGTVDAAGSELTGTYINGQGVAAPLTFRRAPAAEGEVR